MKKLLFLCVFLFGILFFLFIDFSFADKIENSYAKESTKSDTGIIECSQIHDNLRERLAHNEADAAVNEDNLACYGTGQRRSQIGSCSAHIKRCDVAAQGSIGLNFAKGAL